MRSIAQTILVFIAIFFYSCASSQGLPNSSSKSKKANEYFNTALFHFNSYQTEKALEYVDKAIDKDDKFIDAYMLKGDILGLLDKYDESEQTFDKILTFSPEYVKAYYSKGKIQFRAQRYAGAKTSIEKFLTYPYSQKGYKAECELMLKSCEFAITQLENPVPFKPINMGPNINSAENDYFPGLTADEQRLYFTRLLQGRNEDFYQSVLVDSVWQKAKNMGTPVNTVENEGFVSISTDGQYIFFTACNRPGGFGSCDLYFSKLEGDQWKAPINMRNPVNTGAWESQPSLSYDGKDIYFSSNRPGGYGGSDIWVTSFENNRFTEPRNLGPTINTAEDEQCPFIHMDNKTLYFSSKGWPGMGNSDLYFSKRNADGGWEPPTNLGYPINTGADEISLIVNRRGNWAYFSSNMAGGYGALDIYGFELYEGARPEASSYAKGEIYDAETKQKLEANIELIDLATGEVVMTSRSNTKTGEFLMVLQPHHDYMLNVNKEDYLFHSENFALKESPSDKPFLISVPLSRIKIGEKVILRNVFFDTDKFDLKDASKSELKKLVDLLKSRPKLKIEIGGHTDNTGSKQKNSALSQSRAKSVYDFLLTQGITADRLSYKGYGDSKPIADNATPEGRQKNRRTEFIIIGN